MALTRLRRLFRNQKGNVLVVSALSMPMLVGATAFALDTIQLSLANRQLQRAADSGAIAGAYAVSQDEDAGTAANNDLAENVFPDLTLAPIVEVGPRLGFQRTVRLRLTAQRETPFMAMFTGGAATLTADATAALVDEGVFCVVSLYDGEDTGIDVNGNGDLTLGCGMKANSSSDQAITAGGSSRVSGSPIAAVGGLDGEANNFVPPTRLQPYSAPQEDPLARLPNPPPQSCSSSGSGNGIQVSPREVLTVSPGCFSRMDVKGRLIMTPGTYYINGGDVDIGAQANITGVGVTIVLTGPNGQAGNLRVNAGATLNLTSTSGGPYSGVLFYRDRRAAPSEVKLSGGASLFLTGALYFPTSDVEFVGHAGMNVQCLQLVAQKMRFRGSATIRNNCPADSGASAFRQTVVRLIQ